ncbi:MAG: hypothetical protein ACI4PG_06085, partial [Candidatus Ventricola sp.]
MLRQRGCTRVGACRGSGPIDGRASAIDAVLLRFPHISVSACFGRAARFFGVVKGVCILGVVKAARSVGVVIAARFRGAGRIARFFGVVKVACILGVVMAGVAISVAACVRGIGIAARDAVGRGLAGRRFSRRGFGRRGFAGRRFAGHDVALACNGVIEQGAQARNAGFPGIERMIGIKQLICGILQGFGCAPRQERREMMAAEHEFTSFQWRDM